jgi:pyridoxine 5-phosphate synthase
VNIDHVATLRNARHRLSRSDPRGARRRRAGADAITLHLREDRRHIVDADVRTLRPLLKTRMNLECAVTAEMLDIACECVRMTRASCREARGADDRRPRRRRPLRGRARPASSSPTPACAYRCSSIRTTQIRAAHEAGAPVIELHTGRYADAHDAAEQQREYERIVAGVQAARSWG